MDSNTLSVTCASATARPQINRPGTSNKLEDDPVPAFVDFASELSNITANMSTMGDWSSAKKVSQLVA